MTLVILAMLGAASLAGCVYSFHPDMDRIEGLDAQVLVVEGDIIVGGETVVNLSYAMPLDMGILTNDGHLWRASVWVEDEQGNVWNGVQQNKYTLYKVDTRDLDKNGTYRLCISIPNDGEYASEFKKCLPTPAIEELRYSVPQDSSCVYIEVSSQKGGESTGYYKWSYNEVWHNKPDIIAELNYHPSGYMYHKSAEEMHTLFNCYKSQNSTDIMIANTEYLQENKITGEKIVTIGTTDNRISKLYMIAVTQSAIDAQGYRYWESMKKNTTGTGGLFAPQPSEVRGNIASLTSENQQVIGYINVSSVSIDTLFINHRKLGIYDDSRCRNSVKRYKKTFWYDVYHNEGWRPIAYMKDENGNDLTDEAQWAPATCVTVDICIPKPSYWPE